VALKPSQRFLVTQPIHKQPLRPHFSQEVQIRLNALPRIRHRQLRSGWRISPRAGHLGLRVPILSFRLALLVPVSACSNLPGPENGPAPTADVSVVVENRNFSDATIYATDGDNRVRVGRVTGKTTEEFSFKWYRSEVYMVVDFTGGGQLFSPRQVVVPGEVDRFLLVIGVSPNGPVMLTGRR